MDEDLNIYHVWMFGFYTLERSNTEACSWGSQVSGEACELAQVLKNY